MIYLFTPEPVPSSLVALRHLNHAISDVLVQRILLSFGVCGYLSKVFSVEKFERKQT